MKELLSLKTVVGMLSSAAITVTMVAGFDSASSSMPTQWPVAMNRAASPVQVELLSGSGAQSCEWVDRDGATRLGRCPTVVVTAKRPSADMVARARVQRDLAAPNLALSDAPAKSLRAGN